MSAPTTFTDVPAYLIDDRDLSSLHLYHLALQHARLFRDRHDEWLVGQEAADGDLTARNELILRNLRFAYSRAKRYRYAPVAIEDLIAAANVGLIKAAVRFNPDKNVRFISYAVHWIDQQLHSTISSQGFSVRLPQNQYQNIFQKSRKAISILAYGTTARPSTIHDWLNNFEDVTTETAVSVLRAVTPPLSIDTLPDLEQETKLESVRLRRGVAPELEQQCHLTLRDELLHALLESKLTERELDIIHRYYGFDQDDQTLEEIGRVHDVTRERIRQLRNRALDKLKSSAIIDAVKRDYWSVPTEDETNTDEGQRDDSSRKAGEGS